MIELGSKVKDSITGFEGVSTGRAEYLHGCPSVLVESTELQEGEVKKQWIDEPRLIVLKGAGNAIR